jgi:hypothetical protein
VLPFGVERQHRFAWIPDASVGRIHAVSRCILIETHFERIAGISMGLGVGGQHYGEERPRFIG